MKRLLLTICLILCSIYSSAQAWSGILATSRAIDWSSVGAANIGTPRTQCGATIAAYGSSGTPQSAAAINTALAACPYNGFVLLGPGTFYLNTGIYFPFGGSNSSGCSTNCSNVTLRGSGPSSTFIIFSGGTSSSYCNPHSICASGSSNNYAGGPSNSASWAAGYSQGTILITLNSLVNSAPVVGQPIILDQIDNQSDNGALYIGCEYPDGSTSCPNISQVASGYQRGEGSYTTVRGQQQFVTVTSISGSGTGPYTVGITPGLYASNWNAVPGTSLPGAWWASGPVYNDGVESLSEDLTAWTNAGGSGITFYNCQGCWVKAVRSITSSAGGTGWYHVGFANSNHGTVRDSYFYGYQGDDYGVSTYGAGDILTENNIHQYPAENGFYNSDCEGCVSTYEFTVNPYFGQSANWLAQPSDFHSIALFTLFEGNIGAGIYEDDFHGSHGLNTQFRNRWDGREQNNGGATSSQTLAMVLYPNARYNNTVGNVLGTPGYHTTYKTTPTQCPTPGTCAAWDTTVIGAGVGNTVSANDALVNTTSMFWGNWDNVDNTTRWCGNSSNTGWSTTCGSVSEVPTGLSSYANTVPATQTLPSSFIYTTKPSWWTSGKAWPNIGPDVTGGNVGQCSGGTYDSSEVLSPGSNCTGGTFTAVGGGLVVSNPAMDCYFAMGGNPNGTGSALTGFNSSNCPYLAPATQASAPSCTPTSGTVPQTVTCTNPNSGTTVMCYNFTGGPTTDGTGAGCGAGSTKYTTALTISVPETLYIVAGTSTLTDSAVSSYRYLGTSARPVNLIIARQLQNAEASQ